MGMSTTNTNTCAKFIVIGKSPNFKLWSKIRITEYEKKNKKKQNMASTQLPFLLFIVKIIITFFLFCS